MSNTEDSESEWKECKSKGEKGSKTKYSQKFCEKWLTAFKPWLSRCDDDPHKPFCKACQTRLDCNRCHLQRHEQTSKHARNLDILIKKGEVVARQNLSIRQERSKYYQQRKRSNVNIESTTPDVSDETPADYIEEYMPLSPTPNKVEPEDNVEFDFSQSATVPLNAVTEEYHEDTILKHEIEDEQAQNPLPLRIESTPKTTRKVQTNQVQNQNEIEAPKQDIVAKKERIKLLMQIQQDKNDLLHTFKELVNPNDSTLKSPPKEKSHVDLFFDSVSSSVKALSPKLVAEAKMRVSQLICELELRALTENNGNAVNTSNTAATVMVTSNPANSFIINSTVGQVMHSNQNQTQSALHEQNYSALS